MGAVEERDRHEVDQVEHEAGVGERAQEVGVHRDGRGEAPRGRDPSYDRPRQRDPGVHPGVEAHVAERDVRAEERDEDRQLRIEPEPLRLDVVAELVDEDEQDDADAELPAPDQRIAADREEDPEELEDERAELDHDPDEHDQGRERACASSERRVRSCSLGSVSGSGAVTGSSGRLRSAT